MSGPPRHHATLDKLRQLAATLPEASEVEAWEHPTFRAGKKIFASFGEHEGRPSIGVKSTHPDQILFVRDARRFFVPPYVGQHGWLGIYADEVPWPMIADLVETSYRMVALKRMVATLDGQTGGPIKTRAPRRRR